MTFIHERFTDEHTRDLHIEGWNGSFDKLEKLLEEQYGNKTKSIAI